MMSDRDFAKFWNDTFDPKEVTLRERLAQVAWISWNFCIEETLALLALLPGSFQKPKMRGLFAGECVFHFHGKVPFLIVKELVVHPSAHGIEAAAVLHHNENDKFSMVAFGFWRRTETPDRVLTIDQALFALEKVARLCHFFTCRHVVWHVVWLHITSFVSSWFARQRCQLRCYHGKYYKPGYHIKFAKETHRIFSALKNRLIYICQNS